MASGPAALWKLGLHYHPASRERRGFDVSNCQAACTTSATMDVTLADSTVSVRDSIIGPGLRMLWHGDLKTRSFGFWTDAMHSELIH